MLNLHSVSIIPQLGHLPCQLMKLGTQAEAKAAVCLTWFLIMQIEGRERRRYPPHPLATLDMQKTATRVLRMPGK
jgi:DNA topoisomerase IA